jgi:uncharacterized protein YcbK (DUF882 family)
MRSSARSSSEPAHLPRPHPARAPELDRLGKDPVRKKREPFRIIIASDPQRPLRTIAIPARLPAIALGVLGAIALAALGFGLASYHLRGAVDGLRTEVAAMSEAADHLARVAPLPRTGTPAPASDPVLDGSPGTRARPEKEIPPERRGRLQLALVNTGEELEVTLDQATGELDEPSYRALRHLLRCQHSSAEAPIDPRLVELLHAISVRTGKKILVVSGFRLPVYSKAAYTYHARGMAADIRVPGMTALMLRDLAIAMGVKGVGYYPKSQFVHVDVREQKSYWIDYGDDRSEEEDGTGE